MTLDGFPITNTISFLSDKPDPSLNRWSYGKTIKIDVADFYFNPRWITWRGEKQWVVDYELFAGMIRDWVRGCTEAESQIPMFNKRPMTKEEALDLAFEIGRSVPDAV